MKRTIMVLVWALAILMAGSALAEGSIGTFSTVDADGNTVTEAVFADYDLTMVNCWATWCGYCVNEMKVFPALKDALPENVNLVTVCSDASYDPELAKEILSSVGANFTTLAANESMLSGVLNTVQAFPTTFFVDSQGNVVGEPVVGVPNMDEPGSAYLDLVNNALSILEG